MAQRRLQGLQRVLGVNALFATAYGNVGSSIYYALGVTAVFALGLTPLVFVVAGLIFACTAATYAEGTVRYPEAGGSSSFARHAFNELVSFGAAWAQMLVYIVTVATSAFFVPHYLSIFWDPLRTNPWDVVGGIVVIVILVALNISGVQEAAKLSISLAVVDVPPDAIVSSRCMLSRITRNPAAIPSTAPNPETNRPVDVVAPGATLSARRSPHTHDRPRTTAHRVARAPIARRICGSEMRT